MKKTWKQRLGAVFMTVLMVIGAPFSGLDTISSAAPAVIEPDYEKLAYDYTINGWNNDHVVRDADGFLADGYTYCLDRKEAAPSGQKAARVLLSELEGYTKSHDYPKVYTEASKIRIMALLKYGKTGTADGKDSISTFVSELTISNDQMAAIRKKAGDGFDEEEFKSNWNKYMIKDSDLLQHLVWVFVHDESDWQRLVTDSKKDDEAAGRPYTGHDDVYRERERDYYAYTSDDPLNDDHSLWNMYFQKIADYIDTKLKPQVEQDFADGWDAYVYIGENNKVGKEHQTMIGAPFKKEKAPKANIMIAKTDPDASKRGENIPNAQLLLESKTEGVTFEGVTAENASNTSVSEDMKSMSFSTGYDEAVFSGLKPGDYTLTETRAPRNFIKNTAPIDFTVKTDPETNDSYVEMNGERVITNRVIVHNRRGRIRLRKYIKGTDIRIADAIYSIYHGDDLDENNNVKEGVSPIESYVTHTGSDTVFDSFNFGSEYVIMETNTPGGYILSKDFIRFIVTDDGSKYGKIDYSVSGEDMEVELTDEGIMLNCYDEALRVKVSKKDIVSGEEVPGARITISGNAYKQGSYIKDAEIEIGGVPVEEKDVTRVTKDISTKESYISFTSGSAPAEIIGIPAGDYRYFEASAPEGYILDTTEVFFSVDEQGNVTTRSGETIADKTVTITNKKTEMTVSKREIGGSEELPGAELTIYRSADLNSNGTLKDGKEPIMSWVSESTPRTITGLRTGVNYVLREESAPAGYGRITTDIPFRFRVDGTLTVDGSETSDNILLVEDEPLTVTVSKRDITGGDEELPGAVLSIKADTQGVTLENVTAKSGNKDVDLTRNADNTEISFVSGTEAAVLRRIPAGEYTLTETAAPDGYTIAAETGFTVGEDGTVTADGKAADENRIVINDKRTEVKISKVDIADSRELAGAELSVYKRSELDANGESALPVESWVSGSDGTDNDQKLLPHTIYGLSTDTEYVLRETVAPEGYNLTTDILFAIDKNGKVTAAGAPVTEDGVILVEDSWGSVKVSKVDIADSSEIAGAELSVYKKSELDADGENAVPVDSWVSGSDGRDNDEKLLPHTVNGLDNDTEYVLRETVAPEGYMLTTDIVFTVGKDGKVTAAGAPVTEDGVILVEDAKGTVRVSKVDIADGKELPGAEIQLLDGEGSVIETWVSTEEAHEINGLSANKEYTLRETVAPAGYSRTATDIRFILQNDGTLVTTAKVTEDGVILVEDTINTLSIKKTDLVDGSEVPGASLTVKAVTEGVTLENVTAKTGDAETALELSSDKTELTFISGETETVLTGLPEGKYTLTEKTAPEGYELNTSEISFEVKSDGTTNGDVITLGDAPAAVKIDKKDLTGKTEVRNAVLTVTSGSLTPGQWEKIAAAAGVKLTEEKNGVTWVSGSGTVELTGLPNGTYHLRESQGEGRITDAKGNIYSVYETDITFTVDNTKSPAVTVDTGIRDGFNSAMESEYAVYDGEVLTICDAVRVAAAGSTGSSYEGGGSGGSSGGSSGGDTGTSPSDGGSENTAEGGDTASNDGGSESTAEGGDTATNDGGSEGTAEGGDTASNDGGSESTAESGDTASNDGGSESTAEGGDTASNEGGSESTAEGDASSDGGSENTTDENVPTGHAEIPSITLFALAAITVAIRKKSRDR